MSPVTNLLTDPDAFFREQAESPSLKGPAAVIIGIAVFNVAAGYIQSQAMSELFNSVANEAGGGAAAAAFGAFQAIGLIIGFVAPFVFWFIYAGLAYAGSIVFDGDGSFTTTLALVGWGSAPSLVGSIAQTAINYYRFNVRGFSIPQNPSPEDLQQISQQMQQGDLVLLSAVLGLVFALWIAFLWVFALKHGRSLTLRNAALAALPPILLKLLLALTSFIGFL